MGAWPLLRGRRSAALTTPAAAAAAARRSDNSVLEGAQPCKHVDSQQQSKHVDNQQHSQQHRVESWEKRFAPRWFKWVKRCNRLENINVEDGQWANVGFSAHCHLSSHLCCRWVLFIWPFSRVYSFSNLCIYLMMVLLYIIDEQESVVTILALPSQKLTQIISQFSFIHFLSSFLDMEAYLESTPVGWSVTNTFRFPLCRCLWTVTEHP